MHSEEKIKSLANQKCKEFLGKMVRQVKLCEPKLFIPFAGYFTEAFFYYKPMSHVPFQTQFFSL